jgi:hypothetical protein
MLHQGGASDQALLAIDPEAVRLPEGNRDECQGQVVPILDEGQGQFPYYVIKSKIYISNHISSISVARDTSIFTRDTPIVTIIVTIKVFTIQVFAFRVIAKNIIIGE